MKIVIVGDGKVGFALTQQLAREDHDIVAVSYTHLDVYKRQMWETAAIITTFIIIDP